MAKRKTRRRKRAGVGTRSPSITLRHTKNNPYATTDAQRNNEIEQAKSRKRPRLSTTYERDILSLPGWHDLKEYKATEIISRRKKRKTSKREKASQKKSLRKKS